MTEPRKCCHNCQWLYNRPELAKAGYPCKQGNMPHVYGSIEATNSCRDFLLLDQKYVWTRQDGLCFY